MFILITVFYGPIGTPPHMEGTPVWSGEFINVCRQFGGTWFDACCVFMSRTATDS